MNKIQLITNAVTAHFRARSKALSNSSITQFYQD